MKIEKWLVLGGVATVSAVATGVLVWRSRARQKPTAGAMFIGAVDEVDLGRLDVSEENYDPERIPSEHTEVNELRRRMPFG